MIHYTRGTQVPLTYTFLDASGDPASVSSASFTVVYPSSTPSGALLSHDPGQLKGKQVIAATGSGATWTATWDSSISDPGTVFWNIVSAGPVMSYDSEFVLTGNLANVEAF